MRRMVEGARSRADGMSSGMGLSEGLVREVVPVGAPSTAFGGPPPS